MTAARLELLVVEAGELLSRRPDHHAMQDACCIVRGYAELFSDYPAGEFPWAQVERVLDSMRRCAETGKFQRHRRWRGQLQKRKRRSDAGKRVPQRG